MKTMCSKVFRLKYTSNLKTNGHLLSKTSDADQFFNSTKWHDINNGIQSKYSAFVENVY